MNTPEWLPPGLTGAVLGGMVVAIVGFTAGGCTTSRRDALMATGWATLPEMSSPDRTLAAARLTALDLPTS
ncbi:MAG: hypothetical protein HLUCCO07_03545 [Rhodobacteraceae bacterium HLUCCO07]|nr:MAG: hypothetical protein HLUCCO07_03545 [Rhodobacteraceae bacterium HLUCCO07]